MVAKDLVCGCDERDDPLCGFCTDDLYCPQCACPVAKIFSHEAVRSAGLPRGGSERGAANQEIWVYPSPTDFLFSLSLACLNPERQKTEGQLEIDLESTILEDSKWFEPRLEELGPSDDRSATRFRLKPKPEVAELGATWFAELDCEGETALLTVAGSFQTQVFTIRVCRPPKFSASLDGDGVLPDAIDDDVWNFWKRENLQLLLRLEAKTAPICLKEGFTNEAIESDGSYDVELKDTLRAGEILWPRAPRALSLQIDSSGWQPNAQKELEFALQGRDVHKKKLVLKAEASGDIKFLVEHQLLLEKIFYGSVVCSVDNSWPGPRLEVENNGDAPLSLFPPSISWSDQNDCDWCSVAWIGELEDGKKYLEPGDRAELEMRIDLQDILHGALTEHGALRGEIVLRDKRREWKLPAFIREVAVRPTANSWLAVDFGTTNTYAAVWNDGSVAVSEQAVPSLGGDSPEKFDSTMFFKAIAGPEYEIGPNAALLGNGSPAALVRGLKRGIGIKNEEGKDLTRFVIDPNRESDDFSVSTLVRLMLRRIIRHCEDHMQQTYTKIGVSFPAKFRRERIDALREIIEGVAADFASETPPRTVKFAEPKLDEASAVALGFILDPVTIEKWIEPRLTQDRRSIVVASFDFGGGTIDTALLRIHFDFEASIFHAKYRSEYLGIGGDDSFGGEDVTSATLQLLLFEIQGILEAAADGSPASLPVGSPGDRVTSEARQNFDALWTAAEAIKQYRCEEENNASLVKPTADPTEEAFAGGQNEAGADGDRGDCEAQGKVGRRTLLLSQLTNQLNRLVVERSGGSVSRLMEDPICRGKIEAALERGQLLPSLADICRQQVKSVSGKTLLPNAISERIENCVVELKQFAEMHGATVDYIVLAGASCRLPIVCELFEDKDRNYFPEATVIKDFAHAKSKVACGLLRYLELQSHMRDTVEGLRPATEYTPEPIGIFNPRFRIIHDDAVVIPQCSPVYDRKKWYAMRNVAVGDIWDTEELRVKLYRRDGSPPSLHGYFDLTEMPSWDVADGDLPSDWARIVKSSLGDEADNDDAANQWLHILQVTRCAGGCDESAFRQLLCKLQESHRNEEVSGHVLRHWLHYLRLLRSQDHENRGLLHDRLRSWFGSLKKKDANSEGHRCEVRFRGTLEQMDFRIVDGEQCFGCWPLHCPDERQ